MATTPRDDDLVRLEGAPAARLEEGRRSWRVETEEGLPRMRPRSVGELFDLAIEIFKWRFFPFMSLGILVWLPLRAIQPLFGMHTVMDSESPTLMLTSMGVNGLYPHVAKMVIAALVALTVYANVLGTSIGTRTALVYFLKRSPALLLLTIVSSVMVAVGCCLFVIPGLILEWKLYVAPVALVVERGGVTDAIRRSFTLTEGVFLRWLGVYGIAFVIQSYAGASNYGDHPMVRAYLLEEFGLDQWIYDGALLVMSTVFLAFAFVLISILTSVFYVDCRVRREGHDLALRLRDLQSERGADEDLS